MQLAARHRLRRWRSSGTIFLVVAVAGLLLSTSFSPVFEPPSQSDLVYVRFNLKAQPHRVKARRQGAYGELKSEYLIAHVPYVDSVAHEAWRRLSTVKLSDDIRLLRRRELRSITDPVDVWGVEINGEEVLPFTAVASERKRVIATTYHALLWVLLVAAIVRYSVSSHALRLMRRAR
jgi:hypothetical protein